VFPAAQCQWTLLFDGSNDSFNILQSWTDYVSTQYTGWASVVGGTGQYQNVGGRCYISLYGQEGYTDACELYF